MNEKVYKLPTDQDGKTVPLVPAKIAITQTLQTSISSSTTVAINAATTLIEVSARIGGVYLKWGSTAVTNANFDEYIAAGATRNYVVPVNDGVATGALYTTMRIIEADSGAAAVIIQK